MPDLVHPEHNNGKKEVIRWIDELCGSCSNNGSCRLIQVLCEHTIMTHNGIHVSACDMYVRDDSVEAEPLPDPVEQIQQAQARLRQQIAVMRDIFGESIDVTI